MLVKLTAGLNFINVLHTAFRREDPKIEKDSQVVNLFLGFRDL